MMTKRDVDSIAMWIGMSITLGSTNTNTRLTYARAKINSIVEVSAQKRKAKDDAGDSELLKLLAHAQL